MGEDLNKPPTILSAFALWGWPLWLFCFRFGLLQQPRLLLRLPLR